MPGTTQHDTVYAARIRDIREWICIEKHEICVSTYGHGSGIGTKELCRSCGSSLQCLVRRQASLYEESEFTM
jgi:hypothetical protein